MWSVKICLPVVIPRTNIPRWEHNDCVAAVESFQIPRPQWPVNQADLFPYSAQKKKKNTRLLVTELLVN